MKIRTEKVIYAEDWNEFVEKTYGRPYDLQQQDGCMSRGVINLTVPYEAFDFEETEISKDDEMGVSFKAWLERDPAQKIKDEEYEWQREIWWHRNFYPELQMVANDLHSKGLLEAGNYIIIIDW